MLRLLLLIVAQLCLIYAVPPPHPTGFDSKYVALIDDTKFSLSWSFDQTDITFEVQVLTDGWFGIGFSPKGGMAGADFIIGWIDNSGDNVLLDSHADDNEEGGRAMPIKDKNQDVTLLKAERIDKYLVMRFRRKIKLCDADDFNIVEGTVRLIYAYNDVSPKSESEIAYHGNTNRGQISVNLLNFNNENFAEIETNSFEIRHQSVPIPNNETYYYCNTFKLPTFSQKQHVIQISPVITPGNENLVHHMVVYECFEVNEALVDVGRECYTAIMPPDHKCRNAFFGWGIGGGAFNLPIEAGIPLGDARSPKYLVLEIHYDNPSKIAGQMDSSGLKFTYTSQLRMEDAALLTVSRTTLRHDIIIPPKMDRFVSRAFCSHSCTDLGLRNVPNTEITVFASFLHAHTIAAGMRTRHIRNGVEIGSLGRDDTYDFNFQETRMLRNAVKVKAGDDIILECEYNSTGRVEDTRGGVGTMNEMCVNQLLYYPRMDVLTCASTPKSSNLLLSQCFVMDKKDTYKIKEPATYVGDRQNAILASPDFKIKWNDNTKQVHQYFDSQEFHQVCLHYNGSAMVFEDPYSLMNPITFKPASPPNDYCAGNYPKSVKFLTAIEAVEKIEEICLMQTSKGITLGASFISLVCASILAIVF